MGDPLPGVTGHLRVGKPLQDRLQVLTGQLGVLGVLQMPVAEGRERTGNLGGVAVGRLHNRWMITSALGRS